VQEAARRSCVLFTGPSRRNFNPSYQFRPGAEAEFFFGKQIVAVNRVAELSLWSDLVEAGTAQDRFPCLTGIPAPFKLPPPASLPPGLGIPELPASTGLRIHNPGHWSSSRSLRSLLPQSGRVGPASLLGFCNPQSRAEPRNHDLGESDCLLGISLVESHNPGEVGLEFESRILAPTIWGSPRPARSWG
jgi:hypothetical protein